MAKTENTLNYYTYSVIKLVKQICIKWNAISLKKLISKTSLYIDVSNFIQMF